MATSKQSFARATEPQCLQSAQSEEETHIQASLSTMYVHSVPAPGLQPYPPSQPGALQDATVVPLFLPGMCSSSALPSLTLHIPSSAALQQQRLVAPATSARPKSIGKHICPHCGKDCLKPSVLEKHLRCHTGERPYPCTTCGISFKTQSNLYKHKRTQAHARLSSESDKGTFSSQESMESSKDNCTSPSHEMSGGESADMKRNKEVLPLASVTTPSQVQSAEVKTMSGIEWALHNAAMVGISTTPALQDEVKSLRKTTAEVSVDAENNVSVQPTIALNEDECTRVTSNRTPLQRQEALFSKPSFPFHSKPQSHDSTDSGFSDSSEHHSSSSPGTSLHESNMEALTETTMERQESGDSQMPSEMSSDDPKSKVSIQEKQKLEERISKLIYENSVLVDNKQLENVRPRKTILSKQGSIDLPVPYTYKDSFHFEIRNSKHILSSQNQDRGGGAIHITVPTQHTTSLVHAPLTRSSSLPFTMGGKPSDGAINLNLSRRCSAGHVYPLRSPDQQATGHRSLVRQVAVDCMPGAEGSPVEKCSMSSLSSDGDSIEVGTEHCVKGNYRKKARKFDYTKWHTYKGGTFRKLYNSEKDCPLKMKKTASCSESSESLEIHISQQRENGSVNTSFSSGSCIQNDLEVSSLENNHVKGADMKRDELVTQNTDSHIPSERKKQRTGNDVQVLSIPDVTTGNGCVLMSQPLLSTCATHSSITVTAQKASTQNLHPQGSFMHPFSNQSPFLGNNRNPPICLVSISGTSGAPSGPISSPTVSEAKTSFPPMYQLKIPCSTDGAPASCSGSTLAHSTASASRKSHQTTAEFNPENGVQSSKQCQGVSTVTTFDQNLQDSLYVTNSMPVLSVSCSELNITNSLSKVLTELQSTTPTSVSLVSSLQPSATQHQTSLLQSNCAMDKMSTDPVSSVFYHPLNILTTSENAQPLTSANTTSTASYCAESAQQTHSSDHNHPLFTENESGKQEDQEDENTVDSTASKLLTDDSQGSQSEGKVMLLSGSAQAQNMFYVRTADLQIVMQLISDEQLALIEPHIETSSVTLTKQTSLSQEVCRSDVAQEMKNNGETSKQNASSSCETDTLANKSKAVCSLSSQTDKNDPCTIPQCVSSWSHPQTQIHLSASVDYNKSSAQQLYETQKTLDNSQERNSAGFEVTTDSHPKLVAGEKRAEPCLQDKRENDKEIQDCPISNNHTYTEITRDKEHLMVSNHIQAIKKTEAAEMNETGHLMSATFSGNGERVHTKATTQRRVCIREKKTSTTESQQVHKVLNSTIQPSESKTYLDSGETRAATPNELKQALALEIEENCDFTCSAEKTSSPKPNGTSNIHRVIEDSTKCGTLHTHHASLEIFTEPEEESALERFSIQEKQRIERNLSIHEENSNGGEKMEVEEKEESTVTGDMGDNTGQNGEDDGKQDEKKEEHQTCSRKNLHFSPGETSQLSPETSICTILLSQSCQHQGQEKCNISIIKDSLGNAQDTNQQQKTSKSVTKYYSQTPIENTTQSEFQKEAQTRSSTSYWIYSKGNQTLSAQHKTGSVNVSASVLQHNCGVFRTENTSVASSSSNVSHPTTIQESHTLQKSPAKTHSNSTEPKHFYLGNNSYVEQEDSNSSSDDEQKLVIELE